MARADADPRVQEGKCARCHTTWGFLGAADRRPPKDAGPLGIGCAACHAVHPESKERGAVIGRECAEALRRDAEVPRLLADAVGASADRSRVCLPCHSPTSDAPSATAAALWAGRGGLDPESGAPLAGPAPHARVAGGCVGCHHEGPGDLTHGKGHAFAASRAGCGACHAAKPSSPLRSRAEELFSRIAGRVLTTSIAGSDPAHAGHPRFDTKTREGRAAWDVALVLEDPAADVHNAPYAELLLDAAARALSPPRGGKP
jgi:hypothetical protein